MKESSNLKTNVNEAYKTIRITDKNMFGIPTS